MLEFLKDPVRRATENPRALRTRRNVLLSLCVIKLSWRRWRYKARLRPPYDCVLQCGAVCCSVLLCVAASAAGDTRTDFVLRTIVFCSILQCGAVS